MPTGVMNIKHLLCYPACNDDIFTTSTSILIQKSKKVEPSSFDFFKSSNNNNKLLLSTPPFSTTSNELPILYEFSRHSRSSSIRSVSSSCSSTISSEISDITTTATTTGGDSYFYSSTLNNPTTSGKRQRVNSDLCRSSISLNNSVNVYHHQYYNLVLPERTVSCSATSSPQQQSRKSSATAIKYRNRCNSTSSHIQTRTPWTPEEDGLLQKGYEQGLSWAMISATYLPHRSRGCCWGRFKTLQSKNLIGIYQQRICQRPWKASNQQH